MPEEIDVACPGCNAIFGVPIEYCGETAECAECGTMFEIPTPDEKPGGQFDTTETGAIKGVESDDIGEATNTVRLSRTGIGMIPQIKDNFQLGGSPAPAPAMQKTAGKTFTKPSAPRPAAAPSAPASAPTAPSAPAAAPSPAAAPAQAAATAPETQSAPKEKIIPPAWTNIRLKKGEDISGMRETSASSGATAFMVVIPVIVAGAVGIAQEYVGGIPGAAVAVGVIGVAAFVTAMLMGKAGSKKALVVTTQRSICIVGKERIEVKR